MGRWEPGARDRLVVAAVDLFTEQGYDATTVTQIAGRAGVTRSTFFRHFPDKREVLVAGQETLGRLLAEGPERAMAGLQALAGIGPFYSALIVIRGTGFTDVLPVSEPRVLELAARLYQLGGPPSEAEFRALAQPWKPFRTWTAVLIRAAAARVPGGSGAPAAVR